jgi:hypothetical protein
VIQRFLEALLQVLKASSPLRARDASRVCITTDVADRSN